LFFSRLIYFIHTDYASAEQQEDNDVLRAAEQREICLWVR